MDTGGMDLETSSTEEDTEKSFLPESFEFSAELRHFISSSGKHPVSLFTELHRSVFKTDPKPYCRGVPSEDPNKCNFICSVFVGTDQITGSALSRKKSARFDCFYRALQVLFDKYLYQSVCAPFNIKFHESSTIHELIRQLTYSKYSNLVKENQNIMDADKVVASVFLFNAADRSLNIVSLATGNKCIRGDCLSLLGETLNDCHAEIIARRGLLRFLYAQIISYFRCPDKSIFTRHESGKLFLRPSLSFHLFINTAPCGDARVYDRKGSAGSTKEASDDNENAGKMRFKVENGMGTVLGDGDYGPQTVDGILGGERLRTMSCSDKIMRWNILGVQGSLLSRFILPIYLSSVSIGDAQDGDRLQRALSGRLEDLSPLPPFAQNAPLVGLCQTDMFTRKCDRNLNTSINWNVSDNSIEIVNTITGKTPSGGTSRLSRKMLAQLFQELCSEEGKPVPSGYSYKKIKIHSTQYMDAQKQFLKWLEMKNLGQWHKKPVESSNFII